MSVPASEMAPRLRTVKEQFSSGVGISSSSSASFYSASSSSTNGVKNNALTNISVTEIAPLPNVLWEILFDYLDFPTRRELAKDPILTERPKFKTTPSAAFEAKWLHTQLMNYAVRGEEKTAVAIVNRTPELLLKEGDAIDWSNLHFQGPPMRALLWSTDMDAAKKMAPCFDNLLNGKTELAKQYLEHFTKESEVQDTLWIAQGRQAVEKVIRAIQDAQSNDVCQAALDDFRDHLKPKAVIKTGAQSYGYLYVHAIQLYNTHCGSCDPNWNHEKRHIVENKVIWTLERYIPACLAQAVINYWDVIVKGKELPRYFNLDGRRSGGLFWYPLDARPNSFFAKMPRGQAWWDGFPASARRAPRYLMNYLKQKKLIGEALLSASRQLTQANPRI